MGIKSGEYTSRKTSFTLLEKEYDLSCMQEDKLVPLFTHLCYPFYMMNLAVIQNKNAQRCRPRRAWVHDCKKAFEPLGLHTVLCIDGSMDGSDRQLSVTVWAY